MSKPCCKSMIAIVVLAVVWLAPGPAAAQAPTAGAKKNTWSPSRTPDGQPDFQGIWKHEDWTPNVEEPATGRTVGLDPDAKRNPIVDPADGKIPYQPWAEARRKDVHAHDGNPEAKLEYVDPQARCTPAGVPRLSYATPYNGYRFLQTPGYVVILAEWNHAYQIIPLDGRPHPPSNIHLFMGDSVGHWEGNTLVVDTTNFNELTWFDMRGTIHSDTMHVVERFTMVDADTMDFQATVEDPKVLTRPFKLTYRYDRATKPRPDLAKHSAIKADGSSTFWSEAATGPNFQLFEYACHEGNHYMDLVFAGSGNKR